MAFTPRASALIRQGRTRRAQALIRWTEWSFGAACQRSPRVQEGAGGCWLTTPSSHEQGVDGKDGQVRERVWALVTAGLVSAPCSCSADKKRLSTFQPSLNLIRGKNCARNWMNRVEVAQEGERGSWRCHWCLHEAVIGSTSYLLRAHTVITLTTQRIRLSVQTHPLPPGFFHVPPPLLWQMIQTARRWLALLCKHVTPAG